MTSFYKLKDKKIVYMCNQTLLGTKIINGSILEYEKMEGINVIGQIWEKIIELLFSSKIL